MSHPPAFDDQPLGLTVHSMPTPQDLAAPQQTRMGRWKMLLVLLVCAAPVVASYFTYYVLRPEGRRNFGELINPQKPLPDLVATALDGRQVNLQTLKDQWLLISVAGAACDAACAEFPTCQDSWWPAMDRLDWVWLIDDAAPLAPEIMPALKNATVLRVSAQDLQAWLTPANGATLQDHLFLVDPLGNWMLRFPAQLGAEQAPKAKRDLERLLRAASSWDKAGR